MELESGVLNWSCNLAFELATYLILPVGKIGFGLAVYIMLGKIDFWLAKYFILGKIGFQMAL